MIYVKSTSTQLSTHHAQKNPVNQSKMVGKMRHQHKYNRQAEDLTGERTVLHNKRFRMGVSSVYIFYNRCTYTDVVSNRGFRLVRDI